VQRPCIGAGAYDSKYLLTGMVDCGVCGGTIVQTWNGRKPAYRCWYNHSRGSTVCANALVVHMPLADETILRGITRAVLDPEVMAEALDLALMLPADHFRLRFRDWNGRNYSVTTLTRSNKVGATTRYSAGKKTEGSS